MQLIISSMFSDIRCSARVHFLVGFYISTNRKDTEEQLVRLGVEDPQDPWDVLQGISPLDMYTRPDTGLDPALCLNKSTRGVAT